MRAFVDSQDGYYEFAEDAPPEWYANLTPTDVRSPASMSAPMVVSMRQARLALLAAGHLDAVELAINALPSPQKEAARIEWEYAQEVRRGDPLVEMLASSLSLPEADLDSLFTQAEGL